MQLNQAEALAIVVSQVETDTGESFSPAWRRWTGLLAENDDFQCRVERLLEKVEEGEFPLRQLFERAIAYGIEVGYRLGQFPEDSRCT